MRYWKIAALFIAAVLISLQPIAAAAPDCKTRLCTFLPLIIASQGIAADLDNDAAAWKIYIDPPGRTAQWALENVPSPSRDGRALRVAILGGQPYTNVQAYYELSPNPNVTALQLDLWWRCSETSFNNEGRPSRIQAVELTASKWETDRRFEWAVQWMNVNDGSVARTPTWRLWTGAHWIDTAVSQRLDSNNWHHFVLRGDITADGYVHYEEFVSDGVTTVLGQRFPPTSLSGQGIIVALQLDGNYAEEPYDCFFDNVNLQWFSVVPW